MASGSQKFDGRKIDTKMTHKCLKHLQNRNQIHAKMHPKINVKRSRETCGKPNQSELTGPDPDQVQT